MTALAHGSNLAVECETCKRAAATVCWTVSGHALLTDITSHAARKKAAVRWWAGYDAGVVDGKASVTPVTPPVTPPPVVTELGLPQGAVITTPGNAAKALAALPSGGTLALHGGQYRETLIAPAGRTVTVMPYPGETVWLDGGNVLEQGIVVPGGAKVTFARNTLGPIGVRNHKPTVEEAGGGKLDAAVYVAGAGSVLDLLITDSAMNGATIYAADVKAVLQVARCQKTGINGYQAARLDLTPDVSAVNLHGYPPEPNTAGVKIVQSVGVTVRTPKLRDFAGVYGLWTDTDCPGVRVIRPDVDGTPVAGRKAGYIGIELEQTSGATRGLVVGGRSTGCTEAGLKYLDQGDVDTWNIDVRGNFVGLYIQQDNRTHAQATGHRIYNVLSDGAHPLIAYDDGGHYNLLGGKMIDELVGFQTTGGYYAELGKAGGMRDSFRTAAALAKAGAAYGGPPATFSAAAKPVPADIAALLAS